VDVEFTPEQEELRASVRRLLLDRSRVRDAVDGPGSGGGELWPALAELGVLGLTAPVASGGAEEPLTTTGVVLEELGRRVSPEPVLAHLGAITALRAATGGAGAGVERLADLACGRAVGALVVDHGAVPDGERLPAATRDGSGWRMEGEVAWVPHAAAADLLVVAARSTDGIVLAGVAAGSEGSTVVASDHVDRSRRFATVRFDGASGDDLGSLRDDALQAVVDRLGVAWVVDGVGAAEGALALAVGYANERRQFGAPIGSFQAVQHLCADMLRDLEVTRAVAYYGLWAADEPDGVDAAERHRAATMALAVASEALPRVGEACIQVHGGIGFTWEHDAHLFHNRLLTLQALFGGTAAHLDDLAAIAVPSPS
jgi:alkylation response protein AidB-like acyl-CoA dehydrogenase